MDVLESKRAESSAEYELICRIIDGEDKLFADLQKRYYRQTFALIRKMIKDVDDAEDLTQESFIKAYKALSSFREGYSFASWLYRIASNTCIDFLRKKRFQTISIERPSPNSDDDGSFDVEDTGYLPDVKVIIDERKAILNDAINALPDQYKQIIKLRHEEDLDYKDIAERLDIPLGTVKAQLFRARKILLEKLKKHQHLFDDV